MSIEDLYRKVRTCVRQLAYRDGLEVIWAYSRFLQDGDFRLPQGINAAKIFLEAEQPRSLLAEWTLEQIAREVIRQSGEVAQRGRSLREWSALAEIANALRDIEGQIYVDLVGASNIQLEMMRIQHRQFVWQQQLFNWRWIIRYYKLFNTDLINPHAEAATGLNIEQIYLIGICYIGIFIDHPRATLKLNIEVPGLDQNLIDRFLAFTSLKRAELSNKLRLEHALDEGFAYRYSSLREFPLVKISYRGVDEVACPIPTLLFWRITTGLYYSLRHLAGFPTALGGSFQRYVGEVLTQRIANQAMRILPEVEYRVGLNRKDSIDWIVQHGDDAALFVECKTMRLTWASKAGMSDLTALDQDIRKLAGAVIQVYRAIRDYRAGHYPHFSFVEQRRIFPIVVTLEDWYMFGFDLPLRLGAAVKAALEAASLPVVWADEMPYAVVSIDEFETVSGVISAVGVSAFLAEKLADEEKRYWSLKSYCNEKYPNEVTNLGGLFQDEYDAMFANLAP